MKISYQELEVNGYTIRGLFTEPDDGYQDVMVMLHGYTGHKNENGFLFKQITEKVLPLGIATLRFDYMGSGDSDGKFQDQTFDTVCNDANKIIDLGLKLNNNKQIILLGFSMGGACASVMAGQRKNDIKKLILMSPAGCMLNLLTNTFKNNHVVDNKYVDLGGYYVSKNFLESFKKYDLYAYAPLFDKDVLITQGLSDLSVFPSVSKKYADLYNNCRYVLISGAPHCYTSVKYREEVESVVVDFLKTK